MKIMYVNIEEGRVTDLTNNTDGVTGIHFGVKYILGNDNVVFNRDGSGFVTVSRFRGRTKLYTFKFVGDGDYMVTPLFVSEYKANGPSFKNLYNFLKKNFRDRFYIEVNNNLRKPYEVVLKTWVDITFNYKFTIQVNDSIISDTDVNDIKLYLLTLQEMDLYRLYKRIGGQSIFVDARTLDVMKQMKEFEREEVR